MRTSTNQMKYPINLRWSADDEAWLAEVPDLPGCMADGATEEEAVREAAKAARLWVETAKRLGREIPVPTGTVASGRFVARLSKSLHRKLQLLAQKENVSLNALVAGIVARGV